MEAWLEGQGLQDAYPPTWQGLFVMLEDVQFGGVVPALKEAVESAIPQGMFVFAIVQSWVLGFAESLHRTMYQARQKAQTKLYIP